MASDNHASYARIGFTIFAGIVAIIGTLVYLGGLRGHESEMFIETYYDKPVAGLSVGSPVNIRGVKVGEVREIDFVGSKYDIEGADNSRIYILMAIDKRKLGIDDGDGSSNSEDDFREFLIEKLCIYATVASSGITGLSRIECDFSPGNPIEAPALSWKPRHLYVPSKISLLDSFSVAATKVMNQINKMDLNTAWSNLNSSVESLARATDGARTMIETRQGDIERLIEDLAATSESIKGLTAELRRNPSLLLRERIPARLEETE